jgi:hypothetical protein
VLLSRPVEQRWPTRSTDEQAGDATPLRFAQDDEIHDTQGVFPKEALNYVRSFENPRPQNDRARGAIPLPARNLKTKGALLEGSLPETTKSQAFDYALPRFQALHDRHI